MKSEVTTIEKGRSIMEACTQMSYEGIGALVVVDRGQPIGIFTERDLLKRAVYQFLDLQTEKLESVMTKNPTCVDPEDDLLVVAERMLEMNVRHFPVMKQGRLLGIISMRDIFPYLLERAKAAPAT